MIARELAVIRHHRPEVVTPTRSRAFSRESFMIAIGYVLTVTAALDCSVMNECAFECMHRRVPRQCWFVSVRQTIGCRLDW
jgi:hypothetical protein